MDALEFSLLNHIAFINHGTPKQIKTSNVDELSAVHKAIVPCPRIKIKHLFLPFIFYNFQFIKPCLATAILDTISGTLIPIANNVKPITESGIENSFPKNDSNINFTNNLSG